MFKKNVERNHVLILPKVEELPSHSVEVIGRLKANYKVWIDPFTYFRCKYANIKDCLYLYY